MVEEEGTLQALALRRGAKLIAPELLATGCADILWKKAQRRELSTDEALLAARLLQAVDVELLPTRFLLATATRIAIELDRPAYDCPYFALAMENGCPFGTADERLLRKLDRQKPQTLYGKAISLTKAVELQSIALPPRF
ncbi:MAG: type II toxin-antitoxin system VapC family toxin [Proteobacteria bacterium]|nr:type II toxin-antitoxin system VapC family toxin [Pseudomonadota bacterium]